MTKPGGSKVLEFRRAVAPNPILSADEVAARLFPSSRAFTDSALLDFPHYMHAPRFLEPRESVEEILIVGDRRIGRWMLTAEFGTGLAAAGVGLLGIIAGWWA